MAKTSGSVARAIRAIVAVAATAGLACGAAGCDSPSSNSPQPSGSAVLGTAPPGPSPPSTPSAQVSATPTTGQLTASYELKTRLVRHELVITISNETTVTGTWAKLVIVLSGLDVVVSPAGPVNHQADGRTHTFTPEPGIETLAPGGKLVLTIVITGTKPGVTSCNLDGVECTAASA